MNHPATSFNANERPTDKVRNGDGHDPALPVHALPTRAEELRGVTSFGHPGTERSEPVDQKVGETGSTALPGSDAPSVFDSTSGSVDALTGAGQMSSAVSDEQLLSAYLAGEGNAFVQLVERYQRELFHFLVRFLGDRTSAEDIFQESFLQVHQSAAQFDPARRFKPWLFTIAANKSRDLMRSQSRRPTTPLQASVGGNDDDSVEFIDLMRAASETPSEPMERRELAELVHNTVMGMPDHLREILLLSYFQQFPYKQIGEILDLPLGTVKSRLHTAVAYFADRWKQLNRGRSVS